MTTLRGPDPYALAEARLDALGAEARGWADTCDGVCAALHGAIPTHDRVEVAMVRESGWATVAARGRAGGAAPSFVGRAVAAGETIVRDELAGADGFPAWARSAIAVPLGDAGQARGAIVVVSAHRGAFGPADRALLDGAAAALARGLPPGPTDDEGRDGEWPR